MATSHLNKKNIFLLLLESLLFALTESLPGAATL
jgi:hypothetical protein